MHLSDKPELTLCSLCVVLKVEGCITTVKTVFCTQETNWLTLEDCFCGLSFKWMVFSAAFLKLCNWFKIYNQSTGVWFLLTNQSRCFLGIHLFSHTWHQWHSYAVSLIGSISSFLLCVNTMTCSTGNWKTRGLVLTIPRNKPSWVFFVVSAWDENNEDWRVKCESFQVWRINFVWLFSLIVRYFLLQQCMIFSRLDLLR